MKYRQEIDGLRALAVTAVILNHMSKDVLPSGYLGVDVFFVISGYVITLSLYKRSSSSIGGLLLDFYVRRIKRLIPALVLFVVITSIIISLFNPNPAQTLETGLASLFGLSNLYLIRSASDYFGDSAQLNVFTHTWSLGVEEQFYILFPFIVWLTAFGRDSKGYKRFYVFLGLFTIASLAAFINLSITKPYFAYYFMPTRFWELAAGAFAFWMNHNPTKIAKNTAFPQGLSLLSIMMTLMVFFAPEKFIIITTLLIVALTMLLILATQPETIGFKIFASRPLVYIGQISYSLYLWHWSVLSISRWTIGIHLWTAPLQVALMLLLAVASYTYVESPLRKANWSSHRLITIGYGIAAMATASVLVLLLEKPLNGRLYTGKEPDLIATGIQSLTDEYSISGDQFRWQGKKCVLSDNNQVGKVIAISNCTLGDFENAKTRIMVIGNSFSTAFVHAFDQMVSEDNYSVTITSSWGASQVKELPNDGPWNKANYYYWETVVPQLLSRLKAGDWVFMVNDMAELSPKETSTETNNRLETLKKGLEIFSNDLASRQINLAILHGNPFAREANCEPSIAIKQWFSPFDKRCTFITKEETIKRRNSLDQILISLGNQNKITVVDLLDIFCPNEICSYQAKNGDVLYRDAWSHPSVEGARLSAPVIRRALNPEAQIP